MDPDLRQKIIELHELTKENNQILRSLRRAQRWANIMRFIYWILIIGISIGAYYYIQPYLEQVLKLYSENQALVDKVKTIGVSIPDVSHLQEFFGQIKGGK